MSVRSTLPDRVGSADYIEPPLIAGSGNLRGTALFTRSSMIHGRSAALGL